MNFSKNFILAELNLIKPFIFVVHALLHSYRIPLHIFASQGAEWTENPRLAKMTSACKITFSHALTS